MLNIINKTLNLINVILINKKTNFIYFNFKIKLFKFLFLFAYFLLIIYPDLNKSTAICPR